MKSVLFACLTWLATAPAYAFLEGFFEPVPDEVPLTDQRLKASQDGWDSLIPEDAYHFVPDEPTIELITSDEFQAQLRQAESAINRTLSGSMIELGGFMVPLEMEGDQVTQFLLVPEPGQCVHLPAPPVNQTVLVDATASPVEFRSLYDPIWVQGPVEVFQEDVEIAQTGYRIIAPRISNLLIEGYNPSDVPRHEGD